MDNIQRRMQQVTKTAAQWESENPILAEGLIGVVKETGRMKAGDGVKHWNELKFELDYFPAGEYVKQINLEYNKPFIDGNYYRNALYFPWNDQNKVIKRYIYFGKISLSGAIRVSATSLWHVENASGILTKEIDLGISGSGTIYSQTAKYTFVGEATKDWFSISNVAYDAEKGYYLYVEERVTSKNPLNITIEIFSDGNGSAFNDLAKNPLITSVVAADNESLAKPEYGLGNDGQFAYKDYEHITTVAELISALDNIPFSPGVSINSYVKTIFVDGDLGLPYGEYLVIGMAGSGGYSSQIAFSYYDRYFYRRCKVGDANPWGAWHKILEMTDMPSTKNTYSGYFKLPTGHILQYGYVSNATAEGLQVTWPVAITRVPMSPIVTPEINGEITGYYAYSYAASDNKNNFTLRSNYPTVSWMCITL